jgi:hypothetical protein
MPADLAAMILTSLLAAGTAPPETPDAELLEFLASFETADGKWVDPLIFDDQSAEAPAPRREEQHR